MALLFFGVLELCELRFEVEELGAEVGDTFCAFGGFVGDELDVDAALVVVEGAREGGQRGGELALQGGIGAWAVGEGC